MSDPKRSAKALNELAGSGVRLAADDFGTGYSSLAYLNTFPLDALKIDRSFTSALPAGIQDAVITRAVVALARALGLEVVAEGIETTDQRACLSTLGVPYGQGYLWSAAIRADAFEALVLANGAGTSVGPAPAHGERSAPPVHPGPRVAAPEIDQLDSVMRVLAHEIRTPLAVVRGYAGLIGGTSDPTEARRGCEAIERAATRIDRILEDLTVATRPEGLLDRRPVAIRETVADVVDDFETAAHVDLRVTQHITEATAVAGDAAQISQAISNLLTNALRFSPDGAEVEVVVRADEHWVDIDVSDEGPGVEPTVLGLIFRKYGRADPTSPGSGLGLYLARQTARAHGGNLLVCRRPAGPGATFTIRLPRLRD